jgi:hypothetical protein
MAFPTYVHDPDAFLDYPVNWAEGPDGEPGWLADGDTAVAVEMRVTDGIVVGDSGVSLDGTITYAWLSLNSPVINRKYNATYHTTFASGRVDDRTITLVAKER